MDASPFSRLSPELRNSIYELVSFNEDPHHIIGRSSNPAKLERRVPQPRSQSPVKLRYPFEGWFDESTYTYDDVLYPTPNLLALQGTCSDIRNESITLFYATNRFIFDTSRGFQTFCSMVGETNMAALRDVVVSVGSFCTPTMTGLKTMLRGAQMMAEMMAGVVEMVGVLPKCSLQMQYVVHDRPSSHIILTADAHELLISFARARKITKDWPRLNGAAENCCEFAISELEMAIQGEGGGEARWQQLVAHGRAWWREVDVEILKD